MNANDAVRVSERNRQMVDMSSATIGATQPQPTVGSNAANAVEESVNGLLKNASVNRLACLFRHWTWADEAMKHFEHQLVDGWDYDEDPLADHPFGAYYHWCALLCGFAEAALERGLLTQLQLEALRPDLEASLPGLQACRQLLVVIPESLEEHPRIVDLLRDNQALDRLRRIHHVLGEALRKEQMSREIDWLLL